MQEFKVEEKIPSRKEYFKIMRLHFLAYADLMEFSGFDPTLKQIKKLTESMEQKVKELKKMDRGVNEKEALVLKLFLKQAEVCRRHLNNLFPDKKRGAKHGYLASMVRKGFIKMHSMSTNTHYTITPKGQELLKEITST